MWENCGTLEVEKSQRFGAQKNQKFFNLCLFFDYSQGKFLGEM